MARDLHGILQDHQQRMRDEHPWIWLYEFEVPTDPPTRYRLTNYTATVPFGIDTATGDPLLYLPYPIVHGEIEQTKTGDLPRIRVSIANAAREVSETLEAYDGMIGQSAVLRLVNAQALSSPQAQVRFDASILRARSTVDAVYLDLAAEGPLRAMLPRRRYMRRHCTLQFGSPECGYAIPTTAGNTIGTGFAYCGKMFSDCVTRGEDEVARGLARKHPLGFGGFLGMGKSYR